MPHDPQALLHDIAGAIALITRFTAGKTRADYAADPFLRSAVERQYEIIGEAVNRLVKVAPMMAERIREYRRIIAFRNVLAHGYDTISHDVSWDIIENKLSFLREDVAALRG